MTVCVCTGEHRCAFVCVLEPFDPGFCGNSINKTAVELGSLLGVLTLGSIVYLHSHLRVCIYSCTHTHTHTQFCFFPLGQIYSLISFLRCDSRFDLSRWALSVMYAESVRFGGMLGKKRYDKRHRFIFVHQTGIMIISYSKCMTCADILKDQYGVDIGNVTDLDDFNIHYDITLFWFDLNIMYYANEVKVC